MLKTRKATPAKATAAKKTTGKAATTSKLTVDKEGYPVYLPEMQIDQPGTYDTDLNDVPGIAISGIIQEAGGGWFEQADGKRYIVAQFDCITTQQFEFFKKKFKAKTACDKDIRVMFKRVYENFLPNVEGGGRRLPRVGDRAVLTIGKVKFQDCTDWGVTSFTLLKGSKGKSSRASLLEDDEPEAKPVKKTKPSKKAASDEIIEDSKKRKALAKKAGVKTKTEAAPRFK